MITHGSAFPDFKMIEVMKNSCREGKKKEVIQEERETLSNFFNHPKDRGCLGRHPGN